MVTGLLGVVLVNHGYGSVGVVLVNPGYGSVGGLFL